MRRCALALLQLALAGCSEAVPEQPVAAPNAGARLERAATAAGLVAPIGDPSGLYVADTDRICVVPAESGFRIGAVIDYGNAQGCGAAGTAVVDGTLLRVDLGADCRFVARFEGDRIVFPTRLARSCDRACTGRITLAALTVPRIGTSISEARALRDPRGGAPCAS